VTEQPQANRQAFLAPHDPRPGLQSKVCGEHQVTEIEYTVKLAFPEAFRKRTLLLVVHTNPHYVNQLPPHEQRAYCGRRAFPLSRSAKTIRLTTSTIAVTLEKQVRTKCPRMLLRTSVPWRNDLDISRLERALINAIFV